MAGFIFGCTHVFYHPDRIVYSHPTQFKLAVKEVGIKSGPEEVEIVGWLISKPDRKEKKELIVQFHGNAQNMSSHYLSLKWLVEEGHDLFIFDYRGYGPSEGTPDPLSLREDALAVLKYARNHLLASRDEKMILYGQSLGGHILMDALVNSSNKNQIRNVVIDSSFDSYRKVAIQKLKANWFFYPLIPLVWPLIDNATSVEGRLNLMRELPLLFIASGSDRIVPPQLMIEMYQNYLGPKCLWNIPGADHLQVYHGRFSSYRKKLLRLFDLPHNNGVDKFGNLCQKISLEKI